MSASHPPWAARRTAWTAPARRLLGTFFRWETAETREIGTHVTGALVALALVGLPALLRPAPDGGLTWFSLRLPPTCASHALFGVDCPGCGLMRAFVLLAHGRVTEALAYHRLAVAVYAFFAGEFVSRVYAICTWPRPLGVRLLRLRNAAGLGLIGLLVANWLAGLFLGGN